MYYLEHQVSCWIGLFPRRKQGVQTQKSQEAQSKSLEDREIG